jgi:hypothetical protein
MRRVQQSQGRPRPQVPEPGSSPLPPGTVLAAPIRDKRTGKFAKGNDAYRLRGLRAIGKRIVGLNPAEVAPWLRPFAALAASDAPRLVEQHGCADDAALVGLCEDVAAARAVFRGLLALGAKGDREALSEAKAWLREHRQAVLSLKCEAREHAKQRGQREGVVDQATIEARVEEMLSAPAEHDDGPGDAASSSQETTRQGGEQEPWEGFDGPPVQAAPMPPEPAPSPYGLQPNGGFRADPFWSAERRFEEEQRARLQKEGRRS